MRVFQENRRIIIFSFLFYLIFRIYFLINYPIELDETTSYFWSREALSKLISLIRSDIHPPLTYFIHRFFDINKTEFGVRWFYFIIFVFSIFFIKKLSDEFLNQKEKLYFWIIFLFSSFIIQRTTVARMHAFSFFLSVSLSYFFFQFVKDPKSVTLFFITLISCFFALNFYPSVVFPFLIYIVLIYLYYKLDFINKILISFTFYVLFVLFTLYVFFPSGTQFHFNLEIPTGLIFPYTIFTFTYNEEIISWNILKTNKYSLFLFFFMLFPVILALYGGYKAVYLSEKWKFYLLICLFSFLINFFASFFIPKLLFSPRYLIYTYPLFLFLITKGLVYFRNIFRNLFLSFYMLYNIFSIYLMLYQNKEDWRKISGIISENRKQNEFVISEYLYPVCFYYNCDDKVFDVSNADVSKIKENIWLVYSSVSRPKLRQDFFEKFKFERSYRVGNIRIMYFRRND